MADAAPPLGRPSARLPLLSPLLALVYIAALPQLAAGATDPFPHVAQTNPDGSMLTCGNGNEGLGRKRNCDLIVKWTDALKVARTHTKVCQKAGRHAFVVDVGARGGDQTKEALSYNFSSVAVDCQQSEFVRLVAMFGENENVVLVNACANKAGEYGFKELYQALGSSSMSKSNIMDHGERRKVEKRRKVTVLSTPLDPYVTSLNRPVCGIKVDVQGMEGPVLDGLGKTIDLYHPIIHMEYDYRWRYTNTSEAVEALHNKGYQCKPKACKICDMVCWHDGTTAAAVA